MYRLIAKRQMKRVVFNYLVVVFAVLTTLTSCSSGTPSMKGITYVNSNAKDKPMVFMTETVGVLEFVDDNKVDILFPYAIDTENFGSGISISRELWISGEYERNGSKITVRFKLNKDQEESGVLEFQVKDEENTLLGEQGESFNKIDK